MKKTIIAFVTVLMLATGYEAKSQINSSISFNTFYDELSPYGRWVDYPQYGQVWISNENGFEPYSSNGHWQFTNYGWMWASDYNWGWAPFHYGRWTYLNNYGWAWVPGYEWAPAWVGWCNYDGYYGWAPLSPGIGFNYSFNSMPLNHWRFVRQQYINDPYVYRHYQRPVRNVNQYQNITVINNTVVNNDVTYVSGPSKAQVETVIKKKIEPKQVAFSNEGVKKTELVNKNEVRVFRPDVKTATTQNSPQVKQQPAKIITDEKAGTEGVNPGGVKKEVLIKNQQQPVKQPQVIKQAQAEGEVQPVQKNNIRKQPIQKATDEQLFEIKKQQQQQQIIKKQAQQNEAAQQAIINQQQQDATKQQQEQIRAQQQQSEAKQQQAIRRQQQQEAARQQEQIRTQQQQSDAKQQQAIRRQQQQEAARQQQQEKQQRQEEMRQQKMQQQQQQPARQQENILPKQTNERPPQQPAKQNRKNNSPF